MELFRISHGPWEKIFEGGLEKNQFFIYTNPESVLLVVAFEKQGTKNVGATVEMFKVFNAKGEVEGFIDTLPREIVLISRHDKKSTSKYLLLGSSASFVDWKEDKVISEIDLMLKKLDTACAIIKDISKAYDIKLEEMSQTESKVRKKFFGEPLLAPALATALPYYEPTTEQSRAATRGDFTVGLTKERKPVVEPLELFERTLVNGGERAQRTHFLHILAESYLLSNVSVVIFDQNKSFKGLNSPTSSAHELKKYEVNIEPIGFPVEIYRVDQNIKVDMNFIDPLGFSQLFGFAKTAPTKIIEATILKNKVKGIDDLIEKIKFTPLTDEVNAYEVKKTIRILKLVKLLQPTLFEGQNNLEDLTQAGVKTIGKASIVDVSGLEPKIVFLLVHNILNAALDYYRKKEKTKGVKSVFVLPELSALIQKQLSADMEKQLEEMIEQLEKLGVGIAVSEGKDIDVPTQISKNLEARVNMVQGNDAGILLKGRKGYRVFLRPGISICSES